MFKLKALGRFAGPFALVLLLAGCGTQAQREAKDIAANTQSADQKAAACYAAVYNSLQYAALRPHVPLKITNATLEQLTDTSKASDIEIKAILVTHPQMQACRQAYADQITATTPTLVPIFVSYWSKNEDSIIALIQKKETWGEFIHGAKDNWADTYPKLLVETQRIGAGLAQENAAELAQRQAATNAMVQYLQTEQIINNMNRPVVTNCTGFGNSVNCISR